MIKFLFCFLIFTLLNCCPKETIIKFEEPYIQCDTIRGFLYNVPDDSLLTIEYGQFPIYDSTIWVDTVKSIIIVPKIK